MEQETKYTDLTFFTNETENTVLERFKAILKTVEFFDIIVGYFRVSGFHQLYKSFEKIEKIRILVGLNIDKKTFQIIETSKLEGKLDFETHTRTKEIVGEKLIDEIEKSEDSQEIENGIRRFIEYLKADKIEIKAHPSQNLHAKVYISRYFKDDRDFGNVITGSSNFSESGLVSNYEFNVQLKNSADVEFALEKFELLWLQAVDISDYYVDTIQNKTYLNDNITPYQIYLKLLYEYFKTDLSLDSNLFYKNIPEGFMKLKYQEQAATNAKKILDEYGGVFLADVVGLGKTFMATLLANQLPGRNLVIASPALLTKDNPNSWINVFHDFKIAAEFESIGKLEKIIERGTDRYDNVFIDEAHKFRNENNVSYENLSAICRGKKVVLITATPLNNSPLDILSQIKLFQKGKNSTIPGLKNLENFFNSLQRRLKDLDRKDDYDAYMDIVKDNAAQIRDKVLKHIMVRRTRKEIETYFKDDLKNQGLKFPIVAPPEPIFYKLDSTLNHVFIKTIALITDELQFKYSRYTPLLYLKEELTDFEKTSQRNMGGFMKILLIKRLESSFFAFNKTLGRFIKSYEDFLGAYNKGKVYVSKKHWQKIMDYLIAENYDAIQKLIDDEKAEEYSKNDFRKSLKTDIESDLKTLKVIENLWKEIDYDPKLDSFIEKINDQKVLKKNKLIIFTESKETAEYLSDKLKIKLNDKVLIYHGGSSEKDLKTVISNFDAKARNKKDNYRIIVTTEVLSEGINLHRSNVVINYDIPWNPTRMIQRVGRINRVDTPFNKIYTYNFFPTEEANDIIKLKEAAIAKIHYFIEMLGNDAKLLTDGEEIKSFELFNKLTSKEFIIGDDDTEESELKYLRVIEDVRDNDKNLFSQLKMLPRKARVARKANVAFKLNENALVTYFRKGKLEKFYLASESQNTELDFLTTAKLFEASSKTPGQKTHKDFHVLLADNKAQIEIDLLEKEETEDTTKRGGRDNANRIRKILNAKEIKRYNAFTDSDDDYLAKVREMLDEGGMPKTVAKRIFAEVKDENNPMKILAAIKRNLPEQFFNHTASAKDVSMSIPKEVILSEYLIK
jgi:superfamily II DNA/RNA helicase/HKD family nuclease